MSVSAAGRPSRGAPGARAPGRSLAALAAVAGLLAACAAAVAAAGASGLPAWPRSVAVSTPARPSPFEPATVRFRPRGPLPRGGYYFAVAVLEHYRFAARRGGPGCAISSDMHKTAYGHPGSDGRVRLTLLPAGSRWCEGARDGSGYYEGAVYAVPHPPPCTRAYPCYGRRACGPAGGFCGVVVRRYEYSYPGGLPKPPDRRSRIIGHFTLHFYAPATG